MPFTIAPNVEDARTKSGLISRRSALGRMAALGGGFLAWNFLGDAFAQTEPAAGAIAGMRTAMAGIAPTTSKVAEGVHLIAGPGGNIGVFVWPEGKLAIDSGIAGASDAILSQIDALGPQPLRILINTHWHFDHTDGNEAFHKRGALIVAHENVRKRMGSPQEIDFFHARLEASPAAALPETTFPSGTTFNLGNEELRLMHVPPAHTDGDTFIRFVNTNVVHTGDLGFSGLYPFIDYSTGGKVDGMVAAATSILAVCDSNTKIIPGHGPVMTTAEFKAFRDMLADIGGNVRKLKRQGKDLAAVVAAKPTAKYDVAHKGFFTPDQFAAIVYSSL